MASKQIIVNEATAKAVAEAKEAAIQDIAAAIIERPQGMTEPRIGGSTMKQPNFHWEADGKYNEIKTFGLEVNSILSTYNTSQAEQLAVVKNGVGHKGLQFLEALTNKEKACATH